VLKDGFLPKIHNRLTLVAGISPRIPGYDPVQAHMGFGRTKMALGNTFIQAILRVSPIIITSQTLHTHSINHHRSYIPLSTDTHRRTKASLSYPLRGPQAYELNHHLWQLCLQVGIISIYGFIINVLFTRTLQVTASFLRRYSE
jgi:hypothetical protein